MPMTTKNFSDIITFTRTGSTATYFNSAGVLTTTAADEPRFDYNPATLAARGLLIEEARTNIILQSADFTTTWGPALCTISANTTVSPDGGTNADTLVEDTTTGFRAILQGFTAAANTTYTLSCFIKASARSLVRVYATATASWASAPGAVFNLSNGTIDSGTGATIVPIGNGWYRCSVVGTFGAVGGTPSIGIGPVLTSGGTNNYLGTGANALFIWGAQVEAGAFPTSYIPTTTTPLTRNADQASVNTLSPWYNQTEGTVYAELQSLSPLTAVQSVAVGKYPNVWQIEAGASDSTVWWYGVGAELYISTTYNNIGTVPSGINKFAVSLAASGGQSRSSLNGAAAVNRNGTLTGTATLFSLGKDSANNVNNFLNGYLRRLTYYPRALLAAELQAITA